MQPRNPGLDGLQICGEFRVHLVHGRDGELVALDFGQGGVALIQGLGTSLAEQALMLFCCRIEIDWTQVFSERSHVLAHRAVIGIVDRQHEPTGAFGPRWDPLAVSLVRTGRVVEARRIRLHEDGLQLKAKPTQRFLRFVGRAVVGQIRIVRMGPEAELVALDQVGLNHRLHARPPR